MKINNGNNLNNIMKIYSKSQDLGQNKKIEKKGTKDQLQISPEAKEFQFALDKFKEVDDIRLEKVEAIKKRVQAGTYKVDTKKIAEKMIQDANLRI